MPPIRLVGQEQFHSAARAGRARGVGVYRVSTVKPKAFDDGSRRVRFCFSDGTIDRMGDSIDPNGWETDAFDSNPVALWAHDSSAPPIGRASNVGVEKNRLMGTVEFADAAIYAFGDTIYKLVVAGFINAVSVGFLPIEYSFVDNEPGRGFGIDFKRQELLEISLVPIPANANALIEARSFGIDTRPLSRWADKSLDRGTSILSRPSLIRLRELAREPAGVSDLASYRRARDLKRAREIAARHPKSREEALEKCRQIRARHGIPEPGSDAERYAAEQDLRRRDRAAAADAIMRLGTLW